MAAKYTNTDLYNKITDVDKSTKAELRYQNKALRSELGALGKIVMDTQSTVAGLVEWRTGVKAIEADRLSRMNGTKSDNSWFPIVKKLLELLGYALVIIAGAIGVKLAS